MKLSSFEKETVITFNEEEEHAIIYSRMKRVISYMNSRGYEILETYIDDKPYAYTWKVPVSHIKLPFSRKTRQRKLNGTIK
jgi:hypothetical protein